MKIIYCENCKCQTQHIIFSEQVQCQRCGKGNKKTDSSKVKKASLEGEECICGHLRKEHTNAGCCYFEKGLVDKNLNPAVGKDKFMCKCKHFSSNVQEKNNAIKSS